MNSPHAIVSKLLTWSCVDGPGNRAVLFLQGCNFACAACHNPHTIGLCDQCGLCVPACPTDALKLGAQGMVFDPAFCTHCDACLRACPIRANPMAQPMGIDEVLGVLRANVAFLNGVTVSGGEATMQLKFITALFAAIRAAPELTHLTCFVDTNGHLGPQGWAQLLPHIDGAMLDIKALDDDLHLELTGRNNRKVLASAKLLHASGKLYELRYLMVPGKTDSAAEIARLIEFARGFGPDQRIKLNAFQLHGVQGAAADWPKMPRAGVEAAAATLRAAGFCNVVTPSVWL